MDENTSPAGVAADIETIWPGLRPTPLLELPKLARLAKVGRVYVKAEGERPHGNFKSLGGMLAGLRALARATGAGSLAGLRARRTGAAPLPRLLCASDGNHGLAVASAAQWAGAPARIYLPRDVGDERTQRIEARGARIVRIEGTYDDAVDAAAAAAARGDGLLIADTAADENDPVVRDVMAGYSRLAREIAVQFGEGARERPSHLFAQAGVGGFAAAMAEGLHHAMAAPARIAIVEPEAAACVALALAQGRPVRLAGNLRTSASMLSCGIASAPALKILLRHDARAIAVDERQLRAAVTVLSDTGGPHSTPSGAAGVAGLLKAAADPDLRAAHALEATSSVLLVATEAALHDDRASRFRRSPG